MFVSLTKSPLAPGGAVSDVCNAKLLELWSPALSAGVATTQRAFVRPSRHDGAVERAQGSGTSSTGNVFMSTGIAT